MEFKRVGAKTAARKVDEKYPTDLQMYLDPPTDLIEIEEFKNLAIERVKFFRILESVTVKNSKETPFHQQVIEEMTKQETKTFLPLVKGLGDPESRRKDYISHYILRLCYCRSEEYRRWFIARELEFFRLKFRNIERKEEIVKFMQRSQLSYKPISDEEKTKLSQFLSNSTSAMNMVLDITSFYKVPFTQVLDLVRGRRVFIKGGFAYVPHQDLVSILSSIFRTKLSFSLTICAQNLPALEEDERLSRILKGLHTSYTGSDYAVAKDKNQIPYGAIDGLSKKSFPLCMRTMYDTFKTSHHLRHEARQQLGLFLKGIGVSLEDSIRFWREGFTQKEGIDNEKFQKNYLYNIRHSYGKEGKRANYTPHSCIKIIMKSVGPGENHGCPFKHLDATNLRKLLTTCGLSVRDVGDVSDMATAGHYQLACTRYFEITHATQNATGINHPNQYFEDSQTQIVGKLEKENPQKETYYRKPAVKPTTASQANVATDDWDDDTLDLDLTDILENAEKKSEPMVVDS